MRAVPLVAVFLSALFSAFSAFGADFSVGPVTIAVPQGFEGPVREAQPNTTMVAFTKPRPGSTVKTLLQITLYDLGSPFEGPESQRGDATKNLLLQFLGGVERRRTDFKQSEPKAIVLSGIPASSVSWTGRAQGQETVGVMYCVTFGTFAISFHTQDTGTEPTAAMKDAMQAIASVRIHGA